MIESEAGCKRMATRRQTLALIGAGAAASSPAQAGSSKVLFLHGVASGDPLANQIMLWTRATPSGGPVGAPVGLSWMVAEDPELARVVARGEAVAGPERDYTVKVDVGGLQPGRDYWYAFEAARVTSPVGRFRTLPQGRVERLALAFVTCALYPNGYFNAYDHIARSEQLDAVVELGDYIYEYGAKVDDYGMENGRRLGRVPEPAYDLVTLSDYRTRYAQYRRDADLQAAHARAPWICVWDDHEVCNDTWRGGGENHHERTEGAFDLRREAAMRAYFEWMPIREPQPGRPPEEIYRSFDFGDLASLTMLETRLTARSYQLEYDRAGDIPFIVYDATDPKAKTPVRDHVIDGRVRAEALVSGKPPSPYVIGPDVEAIEAYVADPARTMMGQVQEAWLQETLERSVAAHQPWQLIGNEVVMGRCRSPKIAEAIGPDALAKLLAAMPLERRAPAEKLIEIASYDQPFDLDGWDGYPAARTRFDTMVQGLGGGNVVVISGDSHAFWANRLQPQGGSAPLAVEFGTSAITSPSIADEAGGFQLGPVFTAQNREVAFCDQLAKGCLRLELTPNSATARMIAVEIDAKPYRAHELAAWRLAPTPGPGVGPLQRL